MSKKLIAFRCPVDWAERIASLSKEKQITKTEIILMAIHQCLEKQNPQDLDAA